MIAIGKDVNATAAEVLGNLLVNVPPIKFRTIQIGSNPHNDSGVDILMSAAVAGAEHLLVCKVKQNGQPRHAREAVMQLQNYVFRMTQAATPVLIAPYLSPAARQVCRQSGINFLDFQGNARLAFGTVFIDRVTVDKPAVERRELRSIFKPKSAQVLRVLLRDPKQAWRMADLSLEAEVSLGHVSNVRTALLDREWAEVIAAGFRLKAPDDLLNAWQASYQGPKDSQQLRFYTTLHGAAFETAVRECFAALPKKAHAALASLSAADWIAPYARSETHYFYADPLALASVQGALRLSSAAKGENVVISIPKDRGVFWDLLEPAPGLFCTSALQTFLDLSAGGERGREAADHLRQMKLTWPA